MVRGEHVVLVEVRPKLDKYALDRHGVGVRGLKCGDEKRGPEETTVL